MTMSMKKKKYSLGSTVSNHHGITLNIILDSNVLFLNVQKLVTIPPVYTL